jgi:hypothetical protein
MPGFILAAQKPEFEISEIKVVSQKLNLPNRVFPGRNERAAGLVAS